MQKNKMKGTLILLFVLCLKSSWEQDWKPMSFKSFVQEYEGYLKRQPEEWYQVEIRTTVYQNEKAVTPLEDQSTKLQVFSKNNYRYGTEGNFQIQNGNLKLNVDTLDKTVVLSDAANEELLGYKAGMFGNIDSTLYTFFYSTTKTGQLLKLVEKKPVSSNESIVFGFEKSSGRMTKLQMIYWPGNYVLQDLADGSNEQPMVVLDYKNFEKITAPESLSAEMNKWLQKQPESKEDYCPVNGYTFYNLRKKK